MAMLEKSQTTLNLGTTNTSPANNLTAGPLGTASATVTRWIRGFTITNNGSAGTWNLAIGTGAVLTAANSLWFGTSIAAGATFVHFFPGRGVRLNVPASDILMGFASSANMSLTINYTEQDLT